ncbi:MAG: hypothetical protein INR71_07820, partial [Terriglobus roseus]|nr:hypothetical protein [Terriglobus roseus]
MPSAAELRRPVSPPIPTVVTNEYFQIPRSAGPDAAAGFVDDEDEGGMVTGGGGSNDTVGPTTATKRRRRKVQRQLDEDDSSDLSDESEDEDEPATAARQLKFQKMPVRHRAGSSPIQRSRLNTNGPSVMVTSPSRPPGDAPLRQDSTSTAGTIRGRPRRDTTTSSDFSSDNESDANLFRKRTVKSRRATDVSDMLHLRIKEEEQDGIDPNEGEDIADESDDSSLASDFSGTADSASLLGALNDDMTSPLEAKLPQFPSNSRTSGASPKKPKPIAQLSQDLPPPRPISMIQPTSLLSMALKVKNKSPESPFERFATLSGKGDPNPLYIKLYVPHSPVKLFELLVRRSADGSNPVVVSEAIGLALYQYGQEKYEPFIDEAKMSVNCWNFRMVEDEEVEYDFPPITRAKPLGDFTSNNNRPQRGRARDKPWDEFALVAASEKEFQDNDKQTPQYSEEARVVQEASKVAAAAPTTLPIRSQHPTPVPTPVPRNPIMGPSFTSAPARKGLDAPLDAPSGPVSHAVPRSGPSKIISVRFTDDNFVTRTIKIEGTTDTYIAEVFDQACKKLNVDKGLYILRVAGSATVVPTDRTIEALGERTDLDLMRRRFQGMAAPGI